VKQCTIAVNSVINWVFFSIILRYILHKTVQKLACPEKPPKNAKLQWGRTTRLPDYQERSSMQLSLPRTGVGKKRECGSAGCRSANG